ncbi:uncharacterized protein LOC128184750 isoform X2 [Crassostrea angulata]|uniref:uncharacterized protein LOC128184750 isoform X2 n=1 Tax=Magallana angulata TaxID=2784310 RepID=UPI0022B125C8|nr:uncharacterized protein LOC128184750 isoform X2 [Crassostrea angulata]
MFRLVTVLISFDLFHFIENRECNGVSGKVCCDGYALNEITRQCEKCPIGYHRSNCSEKCAYPVYGDDCQYICHCNKNECHFVTGCTYNETSFTDNRLSPIREDTTKRNLLSSTNKLVIHRTINYDFSLDSNIYSDTTLAFLLPDTDLLKDYLVTTNTSDRVKETEWQAQYKSLSFDAVEPQLIPLHPDQQGRVNADFTYLTPVFSGNESREARHTGEIRNENEIIPETLLQEQRVCNQKSTSRQDEPNSTNMHDDVQEHVYIEITEEKIESSK